MYIKPILSAAGMSLLLLAGSASAHSFDNEDLYTVAANVATGVATEVATDVATNTDRTSLPAAGAQAAPAQQEEAIDVFAYKLMGSYPEIAEKLSNTVRAQKVETAINGKASQKTGAANDTQDVNCAAQRGSRTAMPSAKSPN